MELHDARNLAIELMTKHGLIQLGWKFEFGRGKLRLGSCNYRNMTIKLSSFFVQMNHEEHIKDTLLHEISHGLCMGIDCHHGYHWKMTCIKIGAKPERLAEDKDIVIPEGKYRWSCPNCNNHGSFHRKPKRTNYICRTCKSKVMVEGLSLQLSCS